MLTRYVRAAMERAQIEWIAEPGEYYGSIPDAPGVWATGETEDACRAELQEVLEDWIALGPALHHAIPVIDGIDINVVVAG